MDELSIDKILNKTASEKNKLLIITVNKYLIKYNNLGVNYAIYKNN